MNIGAPACNLLLVESKITHFEKNWLASHWSVPVGSRYAIALSVAADKARYASHSLIFVINFFNGLLGTVHMCICKHAGLPQPCPSPHDILQICHSTHVL